MNTSGTTIRATGAAPHLRWRGVAVATAILGSLTVGAFGGRLTAQDPADERPAVMSRELPAADALLYLPRREGCRVKIGCSQTGSTAATTP